MDIYVGEDKMILQIFDCNNYVRRRYETDHTGLVLRNLFEFSFHSKDPIIFVFDGKDAKDARRKLYPEYKGNRIKAPDHFYLTLDLFKELVGYTNKLKLEIPGYEADDVIATLIRTKPAAVPAHIWSNDGDFAALLGPTVTQSDPKLSKVAVEDIRLYKTLVGDPSDNIKGINRFGPSDWEKLTDGQKCLWELYLARDLPSFDTPTMEALGLTKLKHEWVKANLPLLEAYWQIVNFVDVPAELMSQYTVAGTKNYPKANALLKEIFQ